MKGTTMSDNQGNSITLSSEQVINALMHTATQSHVQESEARLNHRMDEVKNDLGKRIDEVKGDLGKRIDGTNLRIDDTNKRIDEVKVDLGKRIDKLDSKFDRLTFLFVTLSITLFFKDQIMMLFTQ
ncbi:hypothetical protein AB4427_14610 [Vibrio artabrorum]|uniref:hypothetical protein n=1 Tax=Vibrio artabrorum TaxID=446374 RepID=UPI00354DCBC5